jgi:hypothetical protein
VPPLPKLHQLESSQFSKRNGCSSFWREHGGFAEDDSRDTHSADDLAVYRGGVVDSQWKDN